MEDELLRQVAIPVAALTIGGCLVLFGARDVEKTAGKIALYFGAQTGMNIYMKAVLSHSIVTKDKVGMPAPFILTALQQIISFSAFGLFICISWLTPWPYYPKILSTRKEWLAVVAFSLSFVLNISLNNFSLSLIPISINLIIRSCLPLSTFAFQVSLGKFFGHKQVGTASMIELSLMLAGVSCALLAVLAQNESASHLGNHNPYFFLGVLVCIVSISSASLNLALAGLLGSNLELNAMDMTVYMAIPSVLLLIGPIFFMPHPVNWTGYRSATDWTVFMTVWEASPRTIWLASFSGFFALIYNALTYKIVHTLSATHTAMAGSFNNAATIIIALLVGMESLPPHPLQAFWMVAAVVGNIISFASYNVVKAMARDEGAKVAHARPLVVLEEELEQDINWARELTMERTSLETMERISFGAFGDLPIHLRTCLEKTNSGSPRLRTISESGGYRIVANGSQEDLARMAKLDPQDNSPSSAGDPNDPCESTIRRLVTV